jgi:hypothetical protein
MSRLSEALEQIEFVRRYTLERLDTVPLGDWFTVPPGGLSHVAWQAGHLALTEYRICLARLRTRTPEDDALFPVDSYMKLFGAGSVPGPAADYPHAAEIRAALDRVHARVLAELPAYPDADLDREPLIPHPLYATRIASLRYAPLHEMLHCGQIALIRRMLGHKPVW